jgi:hypothetical protein
MDLNDIELQHNGEFLGSAILLEVGPEAKRPGAICQVIILSEGEIMHEDWIPMHSKSEWMFDTLIHFVLQHEKEPRKYPRPTSFSTHTANVLSHLEFKLLRDFLGVRGSILCQFYNIMCIEWEEDVAYNKGIGLVQKPAWDALGAETITFKLG